MPTFPKQEKLCGQLRIAALYKEGRRFVSFPLRVTVKTASGLLSDPSTTAQRATQEGAQEATQETQGSARIKVLIWAPKSLFKHAVDRNHLRRLIREAYRLEKAPLEKYCEEQQMTMEVAFNYMDKEQHDFETIRHAVRKAIRKLTQTHHENGGKQ